MPYHVDRSKLFVMDFVARDSNSVSIDIRTGLRQRAGIPAGKKIVRPETEVEFLALPADSGRQSKGAVVRGIGEQPQCLTMLSVQMGLTVHSATCLWLSLHDGGAKRPQGATSGDKPNGTASNISNIHRASATVFPSVLE
jgi:hypothetical protein